MGICSMSARVAGILAPIILLLDEYWEPLPRAHLRNHVHHRRPPHPLLAGDPGQTAPPDDRGRRTPRNVSNTRCFAK